MSHINPLTVESLRRFFAKIEPSPECWVWEGSKSSPGYGHFGLDNKTPASHRVAYEWFVGPIPEGLQLDHLCRNPSCVNPAHLEPVTPKENVQRGLAGRLRTHCKHGHKFTHANTVVDYRGHRNCLACRWSGGCRDCGTTISRYSTRCYRCSAITREAAKKAEQNRQDRDDTYERKNQ